MSTRSSSMNDVSSLLFTTSKKKKKCCWIGPIEVTTSSMIHGRGLKVTQDVQAGDCLFVIPPILSVPVHTNYTEADYQTELLQQITLLDCCNDNNNHHSKLLTSIFSQVGNNDKPTTLDYYDANNDNNNDNNSNDAIISILLGQTSMKDDKISFEEWQMDESHCRSIIQRNAFGPDYYGYDTIMQQQQPNNKNQYYWRVLGLYPLAAMINHSCLPNVVRVYSGDLMMAHATSNLKKGEELVWSYVPPHSMSFLQRQSLIQSTFHFTCTCPKCTHQQQQQQQNKYTNDSDDTNSSIVSALLEWNHHPVTMKELMKLHLSFEKQMLQQEQQQQHYLRVDVLSFYIHYFNVFLSQIPRKMSTMQHLLQIADKLHQALQETNYASTEHLSILHMSYDIVCWLHSTKESKFEAQLVYWTEQLKQAHMIRYGSLGHNVEHVRAVMKHTRIILRQKDGLQYIRHQFL